MNKLFKIICIPIVATFICGAIPTFAQSINPITQAALDAYDTLLAQNPNDAFTRYQRAAQLYQLNQYDRALSDIDKGLSCASKKDKVLIHDLNILAANTYIQTGNYERALKYAEDALTQMPGDIPSLYMSGNINLHLNKADDAEKYFKAIQRQQPRNQEAIIGLAHSAILKNDFNTANELLEHAKQLDPTNAVTYNRLGDLNVLMGQYNTAAGHYLNAFSLSSASDINRPINSLLKLSKEHWQEVDDVLDYAISQTKNTTPVLFLKANIAYQNKKYPEAYADYRLLIDKNDVPEESVLINTADAALRQGLINEAAQYADKAIMVKPTSTRAYLLNSQISAAKNDFSNSIRYAQQAVSMSPQNKDALLQLAKALILGKQYDNALAQLNTIIVQNPGDLEALILRGYLIANGLTSQRTGISDYQRASQCDASTPYLKTLKAIALNITGKTLDADSTLTDALIQFRDSNPDKWYLSALYQANTGDIEKARISLAQAIACGFNDKYLSEYDKTPGLSLGILK